MEKANNFGAETGTVNGDGDGVIELGSCRIESASSWQHLQKAGLINNDINDIMTYGPFDSGLATSNEYLGLLPRARGIKTKVTDLTKSPYGQ